MAQRGSSAQFTYDFGIAIAQSTVSKVTRLAGASLTLASAFYALKGAADQYVNTLRENTMRFGGVLATMKAMEQAQDRLIKGQSYFSVEDQMRGMNELASAGVKVGKNLDWINKAAHATGKSFSQFSGMIASAIQGNTGALVEAGLMTQRATRMFDKYAANTVMRQQAILNFIKNHKGLMNAIKNDFETIQDQMRRLQAVWQGFLQSIVGKPNDPSSLYGQMVRAMKNVVDSLAANMQAIRRYGYIIGNTLGWVVKQIGAFVVWLGRITKRAIESVWKVTDNYQEQARSIVVWLEFWKQTIVDFFQQYKGEIKSAIKWFLIFKAASLALTISKDAITSVMMYGRAWKKLMLFMSMGDLGKLGGIAKLTRFKLLRKSSNREILRFFGLEPTKVSEAIQNLGSRDIPNALSKTGSLVKKAFNPKVWFTGLIESGRFLKGLILNFPTIIMAVFNSLRAMWAALNATNPVGWIILAITAAVILYNKWEGFRKVVNYMFKTWWEWIKFLWNLVYGVIIGVLVLLKRIWQFVNNWIIQPIVSFFKWSWNAIKTMWAAFKDSSVGRFIDKYIVTPLKELFNWILKAIRWLLKGAAGILSVINDSLAEQIRKGEQELGMTPSFAATGGHPETDDGTNYLSKGMEAFTGMLGGKSKEPSMAGVNPLMSNSSISDSGSGGGGKGTTNLSFGNGAIQIVVQKGDHIDENKLARKIKETIMDFKRDNDMRGGTI